MDIDGRCTAGGLYCSYKQLGRGLETRDWTRDGELKTATAEWGGYTQGNYCCKPPRAQLHHSSSNMTAQTAGPCWPGVSIQTVASNHVYSSPQHSAEHIMSASLSVIFAMETSLWVVSKNPIANPRFLGFLRVFLNHISLVFSPFLPIFEGNAKMKSPCLRQCLYSRMLT